MMVWQILKMILWPDPETHLFGDPMLLFAVATRKLDSPSKQ